MRVPGTDTAIRSVDDELAPLPPGDLASRVDSLCLRVMLGSQPAVSLATHSPPIAVRHDMLIFPHNVLLCDTAVRRKWKTPFCTVLSFTSA